jgi:hypothetical protein
LQFADIEISSFAESGAGALAETSSLITIEREFGKVQELYFLQYGFVGEVETRTYFCEPSATASKENPPLSR